MNRQGSLRLDGVLAPGERDAVVRALSSFAVTVTSWGEVVEAARTYAMLGLPPQLELEGHSGPVPGRFDEPPLCVLEITPRDPAVLPALEGALAGAGRPAGVLDAIRLRGSLLVECAAQTPLRLLLDVVDVEIAQRGGRSVRAVLPLSDDTLARFAGATLTIPDLDGTRLIEAFTEPLLARGSA